MSEAPVADAAIVGAGPIGLELAIALQPTGLRVLHFDAGQIGHTISWFAPQTQFFSSSDRIAIAGVPLQTVNQGKATREEYLAYLRALVELFDLRVNTFERVIGIDPREGQFHVTTQPSGGKRQYIVKRIILATGGTERPRLLGIPGESLPHVSHYFTDPHLYFRRKLLIVGGKNSAVETAIRCHRAGSEVSLNYRGSQLDEARIKYWLMPEMKWLLETGAIKGYFNAVPTEIKPDHVVLKSTGGQPHNVQADFVLLLTGYVADMTLFKLAGVNLKGHAQIPEFNPHTMETNVPGLYAAGTAVAGTQDRYKIFLENCHVHVDRIVATLTARALPPNAEPSHAIPES